MGHGDEEINFIKGRFGDELTLGGGGVLGTERFLRGTPGTTSLPQGCAISQNRAGSLICWGCHLFLRPALVCGNDPALNRNSKT